MAETGLLAFTPADGGGGQPVEGLVADRPASLRRIDDDGGSAPVTRGDRPEAVLEVVTPQEGFRPMSGPDGFDLRAEVAVTYYDGGKLSVPPTIR